MDETIQGAGIVEIGRARRMVCVIAALALVLGGVALVQGADPARAAPAAVSVGGRGVAALGTSLGTGTAVAQIDVGALIRAIVCPILTNLANGPFGALIGNVIAALRARFGCISP